MCYFTCVLPSKFSSQHKKIVTWMPLSLLIKHFLFISGIFTSAAVTAFVQLIVALRFKALWFWTFREGDAKGQRPLQSTEGIFTLFCKTFKSAYKADLCFPLFSCPLLQHLANYKLILNPFVKLSLPLRSLGVLPARPYPAPRHPTQISQQCLTCKFWHPSTPAVIPEARNCVTTARFELEAGFRNERVDQFILQDPKAAPQV